MYSSLPPTIQIEPKPGKNREFNLAPNQRTVCGHMRGCLAYFLGDQGTIQRCQRVGSYPNTAMHEYT